MTQDHPKRFFSDDSFWNLPIDENAEADPKSDYWISLLQRDPSGENIGLNIKSYTIPIYEVNSKAIPFQKIEQIEHYIVDGKIHTHYGHEPVFDSLGVPVPINMKPSPGGDMHVAIIDWKANLAWDMFFVKQKEDGSWESATGMVYPLDGSGVFDSGEFNVKPNESIHGHGPGVAAGMPIIAGVIRYDEVMSGEIRHKLCGALRYVAFQEYVYPATWTDGNFEGGIPEGAVIQLDPQLDLSLFDLTKEELVVAKALQQYGFVINDFAAGSTVRAEYLVDNRMAFSRKMFKTATEKRGAVPLTVGTSRNMEGSVYFMDMGLDILQSHYNFPASIEDFEKHLEKEKMMGATLERPIWHTEWQRLRPVGDPPTKEVPSEQRTPDYASLAPSVFKSGLGHFWWSLMLKPAYLLFHRKSGVINGLFHEDGAVYSLADAKALSKNPNFKAEERKEKPAWLK